MDNEEEKISLAITTFNRYDLVLESFLQVLPSEHISEIVITDDASEPEIFDKLKAFCDEIPKIKLYRNEKNLDCYLNKRNVVSKCTNKRVILWDSDNVMTMDYINKLLGERPWNDEIIYAPDFAQPNFDYREFSGLVVNQHNAREHVSRRLFLTCLNTCNFFVHREKYLERFDDSIDPVTFDSLYFAYCWLRGGGTYKFVEGLQYHHRVHPESHYLKNNHRSGNLAAEIEQKLRALS